MGGNEGRGKKWAHNLILAKMALLMGHLDGFSLVLPGLTHWAVRIWRVSRAGRPKMASCKYFTVGAIGWGTAFTLYVAPDPPPG